MKDETVVALTRAKESLRLAQEAFDRENREDDEQRLKDARIAGRAAKDAYETSEHKFYEAAVELQGLESKFNAIQSAIEEHNRMKRDPLDFPSEKEQAAWQREADKLAAELEALRPGLRNSHALREGYRSETMEAHAVLERQQWAVRNIQNTLEDPEKHGAPRSSISWVR